MVPRQLDFELFVSESVRCVMEGNGYWEIMGRIERELAAARAQRERPRTDASRHLVLPFGITVTYSDQAARASRFAAILARRV